MAAHYRLFTEYRRGKTKEAEVHNEELKKNPRKNENHKCFATDGTKMENKPFVGLKSKFRRASTFTAEALAVGETLEIIEKIDSEKNFMIFPDPSSVLKGISNCCTMGNTSHITQMLKDKVERLESRGKQIQFYWIPGHCEVEVNERADFEAKQAIKEGRDS
jgi:ribonuclease HI